MTIDAAGSGPDDRPALDPMGYLADPQAELRRLSDAHWCAAGMDLTGRPMPFVLHLEPVRAVLRDRRLSPRSFVEDMVAAGISPRTADQFTPLFRRHGDDHRVFRSLLSAAFTPRRVEHLREVTAEISARLADGLVPTDRSHGSADSVDFVEAFAGPLPPEVFAHLFGLPVDEAPRLSRWATAVFPAFTSTMTRNQIDAVEDVAAEMRAWCADLIAERRADPGDDLVSGLLAAEVDGARLADDDVVDLVSGFVFAGAETTRQQLTAMVRVFAEHPPSWLLLQAHPTLVPNAVEEVLRLRPIVPGLTRVALEPFSLDDLSLDPGDRLLASFQAANTDPTAFAEPEVFDVERTGADAHVTFGWGPHFCVGAGLARMELQEALRTLVERFDPPVVVGGDDATLLVRFAPRPIS